jgi:hypothetical protein
MHHLSLPDGYERSLVLISPVQDLIQVSHRRKNKSESEKHD